MKRNVAGLILSLGSLSAFAAPGEAVPNPVRRAHAKVEITRLNAEGEEQTFVTRELELPVVDESLPGAQARPASLSVPVQLSSGESAQVTLDVEARLATVQPQATSTSNTRHGYRLFHSPLEFVEAFNFFTNSSARRMKVLSATIALNDLNGKILQLGRSQAQIELSTRTSFLSVTSLAPTQIGEIPNADIFLGGIYLLD